MHKRIHPALLLAFLLCLSLALAGCASPHAQPYAGPRRGTNEVAILKAPKEVIGEKAQIKAIDETQHVGNEWIGYSHEIERLPGEHTIEVGYHGGSVKSISAIKLKFTCKAGHVYELHVAKIDEGFAHEVGMAVGVR